MGLATDGIVGPLTRFALVKSLQKELNESRNANLVVDGIFGPRTRAAIPNLGRGARNNLVWLLQAALYIRGKRTVIPDGDFGPLTDAAVRAFQSANGLTVDGIAGPNTFQRLFTF